jgi:P22 coat protein - gene protein 5
MASNQILTNSLITGKSARVLSNNLVLSKCVNRDYDDMFAQAGNKGGQAISVRLPARYTTRTGAVIQEQPDTETYTPLVFVQPIGVDLTFTTYERTFSLDNFSNRVILPAMTQLANSIDQAGYTAVFNSVYNSVGAPGTALTTATARDAVLAAAAKLYDNDAPVDDGMLHEINGTSFNAILSGSNSSVFNPQREIGDIYVKGMQGDFGGFMHYMSQLVPAFTNAARTTANGAVNGPNQVGSTLSVDGFTAGDTLKAGTIFTLAGVNSVNPQTRTDNGSLQQFVVTATTVADGGGAMATLPISPAIVTSGAFQNVTASPADNAVMTVQGASGQSTKNALSFHRDAFMLATVPLPIPGGVVEGAQAIAKDTKVPVRMVTQYDIHTDQWITRFDTAIAWAPLYPQLATRIATT